MAFSAGAEGTAGSEQHGHRRCWRAVELYERAIERARRGGIHRIARPGAVENHRPKGPVSVEGDAHKKPRSPLCAQTGGTIQQRVSLLGNIIWFVFGGLISAIGYWISGVALCITIVGIPFGLQAFKLGFAVLAPFGKDLSQTPEANSPLRIIFNILWLVLFGWELALNHLFWAAVLAITIVGLPFAVQHIKLIPLALFPFGRNLR